ncbi:multidrug resistance efflux transporter family protein [Lactonifactor longoviformis]|uniref:DMT family transporter n=1 Tax=Lactonifactor longoviformis TaxID=341220 RepID=UPI0036F35535
MKKSLMYGIAGSFFFAFTFILNRSMNLGGGYWMWSASLRYFYTMPILLVILWRNRQLKGIWEEIKKQPWIWILWSTVGFGLFYAPLSLASAYGESWLIASTWQITIVAGVLLTPLFGHKIPVKNLAFSLLILAGIFLMQGSHLREAAVSDVRMTVLPILVAAFAYPLGNRKMMSHCPPDITAMQRVFGMTLCSMPFWLAGSVFAWSRAGLPDMGQHAQSFLVALFSGVTATYLFFKATDMVKQNPRRLALVEATQSAEVIFTLLGGILLLGDALPSGLGFGGITLILAGMIANSLITR